MLDLPLDIRTLALLATLAAIIQALSLGALWLAMPGSPGARKWAAGGALMALGFVLIALRGYLPPSVSIVVANLAVAGSHALFLIGVERYCGRPASLAPVAGVLAATLAAFVYFGLIVPDTAMRVAAISVALTLFSGLAAWRLARRPAGLRTSVELLMAGLFALHALFHCFRGTYTLIADRGLGDFMQASSVHALAFIDMMLFAFATGIGFAVLTVVSLTRALQRQLDGKNRIFSILSHDLRSPVASLMTLAELIGLRGRARGDEELTRYAEMASGQVQNTLALLDDLLVWGRAEFAGSVPAAERLDLERLVAEAAAPLRGAAEGKAIAVRCALEVPRAYGVRAHALTVLRNLLSNAVKFSTCGGDVVIASRLEGDNVVVSVTDGGIGLADQPQPDAYGHCRPAGRAGTAGEKSVGLGLAICEDLCRADGQRVWLAANPAGGATGSFTLVADASAVDPGETSGALPDPAAARDTAA